MNLQLTPSSFSVKKCPFQDLEVSMPSNDIYKADYVLPLAKNLEEKKILEIELEICGYCAKEHFSIYYIQHHNIK